MPRPRRRSVVPRGIRTKIRAKEGRDLIEGLFGPCLSDLVDEVYPLPARPLERPPGPRKGDWWAHRRSGRHVHVRRVGKDHVTFTAVRAAGAIRVQYRTALAYFVRTYRPSSPPSRLPPRN